MCLLMVLLNWTKKMVLKKLLCVFFCVSLVNCNDLIGTAGNDILHYLNSNAEQIYRYKSIKSLEILNKVGLNL